MLTLLPGIRFGILPASEMLMSYPLLAKKSVIVFFMKLLLAGFPVTMMVKSAARHNPADCTANRINRQILKKLLKSL
jgi:hypothetical protein